MKNFSLTLLVVPLFLITLFAPFRAFATVPTWDEALSGPCCEGEKAWFKKSFGESVKSAEDPEGSSFRRDFSNAFALPDGESRSPEKGENIKSKYGAPLNPDGEYPADGAQVEFGGGWFYDAWQSTFGPYGWFTQKEIGTKGYYEIVGSGQTLNQPSFDALGFYAAKDTLSALSQNVSEFVTKGRHSLTPGYTGQEEPLFVTNYQNYVGGRVDNATGAFLGEVGSTEICSPFKQDIQRVLEFERGSSDTSAFKEDSICSFDDQTIEDSATDFSVITSYYDFRNMIARPQNNYLGAYFLARTELGKRQVSAAEETTAQYSAGQGFSDLEQCFNNEGIRLKDDGEMETCEYTGPGSENDCYCARFITRTPGQSVKSGLDSIQASLKDVTAGADENIEQEPRQGIESQDYFKDVQGNLERGLCDAELGCGI